MDAYISVRIPDTTTVRASYYPATSTGGRVDTPVPEMVHVVFVAGSEQIDLFGPADLVRHTLADALAAVTETIAEGRA